MILPFGHPPAGMGERPITTCGLACADQGHPRAALDANDLWISGLRAQHPVESYGQLACRCHFGHGTRLVVAMMLILTAESGIGRESGDENPGTDGTFPNVLQSFRN